MRNASDPAARRSFNASSPTGVFELFRGPGVKVIGKTFRPFRTITLSALSVTTDPACPKAPVQSARRVRKNNGHRERRRAFIIGWFSPKRGARGANEGINDARYG